MMRAQHQASALAKVDPKDKDKGKGKEGGLPYSYVSHDDVTHEAKRVLTTNGILFSPFMQEMTQEGNRTRVVVRGVFTNVDDPADQLEFLGIGYGVDGSDKGPGKALSYAKKYILQQALMLDTAEDNEANQTTEFRPVNATKAEQESEALSDVTIKSWADAYREALRGCKTKKDLAKIRAENATMMKRIPETTAEYFIDMIAQLEGALE